MHPCSHPRDGFRLVSKPTSGLLLRLIIVLVASRKNWVLRAGRSSSLRSTSTRSTSLTSTWSFSKRFAGLQEAPRPWIASALCGDSLMTGLNFFPPFLDPARRPILASSHEHIYMSSHVLLNSFRQKTPLLDQVTGDGTIVAINDLGGVAERLNALVLKTGRAQALVSSNLTPSAGWNAL